MSNTKQLVALLKSELASVDAARAKLQTALNVLSPEAPATAAPRRKKKSPMKGKKILPPAARNARNERIRSLVSMGLSHGVVARQTGVSVSRVWQVVHENPLIHADIRHVAQQHVA